MALISKASLLMVPSTYEEGTLYNVLPSGNRAPDSTDQNSGYDQTRADFTFDRGSNAAATRVNSDGLIEKYRENKLLQSNQFDTTWVASSSSVTSGQSGYDDSSNAWLFNSSGGYIYQSGLGSVSGVHTISVYVKAGTAQGFRVRVDQATDANYIIDLSDGSLISESANIAYKSTSVGGGWYRVEMAFVANTITNIQFRVTNLAGNTGSGTAYIQNAQLESGMVSTDVLTSGATTGKAGVLIDLPRINYDANGENGALLLEPSRQQLIQHSEYFGDSSWDTFSGATLGSSFVKSPEGLNNAYTLNFASGNESLIYYNYSSGSATFTTSVWARSDSGKKFCFRHWDGTNAQRSADFTTTTEWQRFDYTLTSPIINFGICNQSAGGVGSIEIYGFQAEAGSYATSYIPNHGESGGVTRAADTCSVTGVSDVIGQTEGTFFLNFKNIEENGTTYLASIDNGTSSERIEIFAYLGDISVSVRDGGVQQVNMISSVEVDGSHKIAFAYKQNDFALYIDGSQISLDTSGTLPTTNQIKLYGRYDEANGGGAQELKQAVLFNERLTNSELATLTTL